MSASNQQGGFRQWLSNQGGNLRELFAIPRDQDGSISWGRFLGQTAAGAALGPFGGLASRALFNPQFQQYGRIAGDSFGRMFDGDGSTGFFNNPSWGGGPRNVAEGHRDFVGPPSPGGPSAYGDPRNMGPHQGGAQDAIFGSNMGSASQNNRTPRQGNSGFGVTSDGRVVFDGTQRQITNLAGNLFNASNPVAWRESGTAASRGRDGEGIGPFGFNDIGTNRGTLQRHNYIR